MKHLLIISILSISIYSIGQREQIRSMAGFAFSKVDESSLRFGPHAGLNYVHFNRDITYFTVGLEYVGKGEKYHYFNHTGQEGLYTSQLIIAQNFLSVPLTCGLHNNSPIFYSVEAGLLLRFLLSASEKRIWNDEFDQFAEFTTKNITSESGRLHFGGLIQLNVGYDITERHTIQLCSRFAFGILRTNDPNPGPNESKYPVIRHLDMSGVFSLSYAHTLNGSGLQR